MFVQDAALGAAAILLYPVQGYIIPKLQRKVRQLGRERIRMVRRLADRIGETIAGRVDIRANGAAVYQLAGISAWLDRIYRVRFDIYNRKFFAKFLNNFINQFTPFLFLAIGGYFVITGRLSLGALVAVLAAYKELSSPWKELLDFYQQQQDVAIKYEQVIEQFDVAGMLDRTAAFTLPDRGGRLSGAVTVTDLTLIDEDGVRLIDGVSFTFPIGEDVAILGPSDSGKSLLAQLLARLLASTSGRIAIGEADLDALPLAVTGRCIGYVGAASHLFSASLRDNLLIGLRRVSLVELESIAKPQADGPAAELDAPAGDIDFAQAGVADAAALEARIGEVLGLIGFADETYGFGLHGRIPEMRQSTLAPRILAARRELHERLAAKRMTQLVERFDPERYNANATIAQNLLFGTPVAPGLEGDALARNPAILALLDRFELRQRLLHVGADVAETMVEIFTDLQSNHELVEEFSLVRGDELAEYAAIVGRLKRGRGETLPEDSAPLLALAFKLIAARHRLGLIDEELQRRILAARRALMTESLPGLRGAIEFFDGERYNAAATVQENLLFGKVALGEANARERVQAAIAEVLAALGLREAVVEVGLGYQLGSGGSRLTLAQRQKVAIARAVLKRPDLLILNDATAVLDDAAQRALLAGLRREFAERSLVCCLHRIESARDFDRILVMDRGRLVGNGAYETVNPKELIASAAAD
jgi:ABC-type multidrug transport system fused ATPase/permease subunit